MSGNTRFSIAVAAVAVVAIVAVAATKIDLGGGDDEPAGDAPAPGEPKPAEAPEDPDDVRGTDPHALMRAENFRRALAVLERRRRPVEGVYEYFRLVT